MLDESVRRAMERWPNVPAVYGWLRLDRRGQWLIRDETIGNATVREFISRNYLSDERGCWAFQNGPQRVFVTLDYTPFIATLGDDGELRRHTGAPLGEVSAVWMDENGDLLLQSGADIALLDDRDLDRMSERFVSGEGEPLDDDAVEAALSTMLEGNALEGDAADLALDLTPGGPPLPLGIIEAASVATRFGFVANPVEPGAD